MKLNRVYGNIQSVPDLAALQKLASEHGLTAVGVLDTGTLHKFVNFSSQPVSKEEALKLLNVTPEELDEIIKFRGKIDIVDDSKILKSCI